MILLSATKANVFLFLFYSKGFLFHSAPVDGWTKWRWSGHPLYLADGIGQLKTHFFLCLLDTFRVQGIRKHESQRLHLFEAALVWNEQKS